MKHTPGPWKIGRIYIAGTGNFRSIFTEWDVNPGWAGPKHICDLTGDDIKNADANARLIAAAPQMLEMLKRLSTISTMNEKVDSELHDLIAKVEGEK